MATKTTEVATVEQGGLPAYLRDNKVVNQDNFDASDIVIPRVKLLQGASVEVQSYDNAKIGNFWHTGMDMDLGPEFRFVVADRRKKFLLMAPMQDGQGILARADDARTWSNKGEWKVKLKNVKDPVVWKIEDLDVAKSHLTEWGTYNPNDESSPPAATLFYDYLVFMPDHLDLGPAVVSVARTAIKKARKGLNDKIKMQGDNGRPMQALIFKASSVDDNANGDAFKNWQFQSAGFNMDESLFKMALEYRGALANMKIAQETETGEQEPEAVGETNF